LALNQVKLNKIGMNPDGSDPEEEARQLQAKREAEELAEIGRL